MKILKLFRFRAKKGNKLSFVNKNRRSQEERAYFWYDFDDDVTPLALFQ
jgi:hypothetical protein